MRGVTGPVMLFVSGLSSTYHSLPVCLTIKDVHADVKFTASEDGYPYSFPSAPDTDDGWPVFSGKELGRDLCALPRACFAGTSAGEVFKRVAFEEAGACGDCRMHYFLLLAGYILIPHPLVIHALRAQSGEYGLSAFLPAPERTIIVDARNSNKYTQDKTVTHTLPLQREGDFRLRSVLADGTRSGVMDVSVNVREWTLRLLERYRFVIGAEFITPYCQY